MATSTVSAKVPQELREELEKIAKAERRTTSNVIQRAIEDFVRQYNKLHPKFWADILEALEAVRHPSSLCEYSSERCPGVEGGDLAEERPV